MLRLCIFGLFFHFLMVDSHARMDFSLGLEKPFGFTSYDLNHTNPDTIIEGEKIRTSIRSELNFPVDPIRFFAGLSSYRSIGSETSKSLNYLRTEGKLWCGITPAFSEMRDEDWLGFQLVEGRGSSLAWRKFSDTYSSVENLMAGGEVNHELALVHLLNFPLVFGLGLNYSGLYYEVFGLTGRQIQSGGHLEKIDPGIPDTYKVGTFFTESFRSNLNFRSTETLLGLAWIVQLHPLIYVHSHDDHILRKKDIVMDSWGVGGNVMATLALKGWNAKPNPTAKFLPYMRVELNRTWGNMRQTYYADSPDDKDKDETGMSINGIKTTVSLWTIAGGVQINFIP